MLTVEAFAAISLHSINSFGLATSRADLQPKHLPDVPESAQGDAFIIGMVQAFTSQAVTLDHSR